MSGDSLGYIASLDVGTTTIRCQIIGPEAKCIGVARANVKLHYPKPGYVEINPDEIWEDIIDVIHRAISESNISPHNVRSFGISTQRATFITWRKDNGKPLHNFITWKDLRAVELIQATNSALPTSVLRWSSYLVYLLTRNKKFGVVSRLKFASSHVTVRLLWVLNNIPEVKQAVKNDNLMFGTMDTWLIYKLTGGKTFVTDISNASATGFYDPFALGWSLLVGLLKIPKNILPSVVNNDFQFGKTSEDVFGVAIDIGCVMADQSSSMFGSCCFKENTLKVTLGTGSFLDVNTATSIHTSLNGMYPLVGWRTSSELIYMAEVPCADSGSLIEWLLQIGIIDGPSTTSDIASDLKDNGGVYFIPAFSGLGPPINNENAATGFIGILPTTRKEHMVRAVLESVVFRIALAFNMLKEERPRNYKAIRVDGGVSNNDFICQMLADTIDVVVQRVPAEMSGMGVAFMAGLNCGMWKTTEEIIKLKVETLFTPTSDVTIKNKCKTELQTWKKAAERFKCWYEGK